jgi:hypothetical protein
MAWSTPHLLHLKCASIDQLEHRIITVEWVNEELIQQSQQLCQDLVAASSTKNMSMDCMFRSNPLLRLCQINLFKSGPNSDR